MQDGKSGLFECNIYYFKFSGCETRDGVQPRQSPISWFPIALGKIYTTQDEYVLSWLYSISYYHLEEKLDSLSMHFFCSCSVQSR
jgi:hypothetical protein